MSLRKNVSSNCRGESIRLSALSWRLRISLHLHHPCLFSFSSIDFQEALANKVFIKLFKFQDYLLIPIEIQFPEILLIHFRSVMKYGSYEKEIDYEDVVTFHKVLYYSIRGTFSVFCIGALDIYFDLQVVHYKDMKGKGLWMKGR